jgi:hypothetical protein
MADLLTPALLDQLLGAAVGATGAALVIAITTPVRRRRRHRAAMHRQELDWHVSPGGAAVARDMAKVAMASWQRTYGPMSALQALMFAVEMLSSDNVTGWTNELDAVRLNVISLARRVVAAHQPTSGGRNGAGGAQ